jgi:uncharacterized protein YbaA (DUF1428 family)
MNYVEGFVLAVPTANREVYRRHAADAAPIFEEFGVLRMVETWGDDVPDGKVTDFRRAVQAKADETVVFSWFEYRSREARDAAQKQMMSDPRLSDMGASMPFDGRRMTMGGFLPIVEAGATAGMGYVDGYLLAVPSANREAYRAMAAEAAGIFAELGAHRTVEAWGDDVPPGEITDFRRAVKATDDESVVFSWVEWPAKAVRDAAWKRFMEEERMKSAVMPFDGQRLIYGGFVPIVDA